MEAQDEEIVYKEEDSCEESSQKVSLERGHLLEQRTLTRISSAPNRQLPIYQSSLIYQILYLETCLMRLFVPIATKCNGPLEAARVSIDDDRYDVAS